MSLGLMPLFGYIVGKTGRRCEWLMVAFIIMWASFLFIILGKEYPNGHEGSEIFFWVITPCVM